MMATDKTIFTPMVSVIIPVYNGAKYMKQAIDSALAQTYSNIEVVVVNDGSTDETNTIAKSYGKRIKYISKENGGVSTALNAGIREMDGSYFSWLSHDDKYDLRKIESQINVLRNLENKKTVIYGGYITINEKSDILEEFHLDQKYTIEDLSRPLFPFFSGLLSGCTLLLPRSVFTEVGLFDEKLKTTQDYELWYRALKLFPIAYDKNCYTYYRLHKSQTGNMDPTFGKQCADFWLGCLQNVNEKEMEDSFGSAFSFWSSMVYVFSAKEYTERVLPYVFDRLKELISLSEMGRETVIASFSYEILREYRILLGNYYKTKERLIELRRRPIFRVLAKLRLVDLSFPSLQ